MRFAHSFCPIEKKSRFRRDWGALVVPREVCTSPRRASSSALWRAFSLASRRHCRAQATDDDCRRRCKGSARLVCINSTRESPFNEQLALRLGDAK